MQYVQEFYQTVRDKCFKLCVTSPGGSLSGSEQKCLGRCMDRYQDVSVLIAGKCLLVLFFVRSRDGDARATSDDDDDASIARLSLFLLSLTRAPASSPLKQNQ
jgi:hypothetical protein